jgi:stage III sporulation protein SpoIIIAA
VQKRETKRKLFSSIIIYEQYTNSYKMIINIDLDKLTKVFPDYIESGIKTNKNKRNLVEIVLDLGRRPEARFLSGSEYLSEQIVSWQDLDYTTKRLGKFSQDNRAGIERTLHRVSCIRNRQGIIIGLTCRIGRCVLGGIGMIQDLLSSEESLLILGKPGLGKTTLIREISRVLSDESQKRVVIIDTSNEIAGDSDITHVGIGRARRMQASSLVNQHSVMIEAIENHMPEVIVVDEIGTELEALAARTIAERGVRLIGTAHGNSLENLIKNPTLCDLIGGIHSVTLSDEEARRRGTQKTIIERKSLPAFPLAIELKGKKAWTIHEKVETSVDVLLKRQILNIESRSQENKKLIQIGHTKITKNPHSFFYELPLIRKIKKPILLKQKSLLLKMKNSEVLFKQKITKKRKNRPKKKPVQDVKVYSFLFPPQNLEKTFRPFKPFVSLTKIVKRADIIIITKKGLQKNLQLQKFLTQNKIPTYLMDKYSVYQYRLILRNICKNFKLK